jgi:hypothetical protein
MSQEQVWKGQRQLAKTEPCRDLSSLQRPHTAHLNRGNARQLGVIPQRPGNGGSRKTAWWGWEDSNCVPGTQSYRTGLCDTASGLARRFARSRTATCTSGFALYREQHFFLPFYPMKMLIPFRTNGHFARRAAGDLLMMRGRKIIAGLGGAAAA